MRVSKPMGSIRLLVVVAVCIIAIAGCGGKASHHQAGGQSPPPAGSGASGRQAAAAPADGQAIARLLRQGRPVYCGGPSKPYAALTFDDGPGVYTRLALRILRTAGVRATFFLVGRNLAPFHGLARAEVAQGDALGNHSFTHPLLSALPAGAVSTQLSATSAAIRGQTAVRVRLFRPPYEARSPAVDAIAQRDGLLEILWNVDSRDSLGANYAGIASNVERGLSPGAIVLMHENRGQTIRALKFQILPALRRRRLHLVTVPQLLALDPPSPAQLRAGRLGCRYHAPTTAGS